MFFSIYRRWCEWHVSVRNGSGGDECALRESLTEGIVLAWGLRQLDQQVIRRYTGAFDDLGVQFFQQSEAGLSRPARDERDSEQGQGVGGPPSPKSGGVEEPGVRERVNQLKKNVRRKISDGEHRLL